MVRLVLIVLALLSCVAAGCRSQSSERTKVAVSIFPIYDLTRRIAGPDADVALLLPPGKSEHTFDPTPKEIEAVAASKVGVMIGLGLDPWMERMMKDAAPKAAIVKVGEKVKTLTVKDDPIGDEAAHKAAGKPDDDHEHDKGATDPHVWLDPKNAIAITSAIRDALQAADAAHAKGYADRAEQLTTSLNALDKEIEAQTKTWSKKELVTFHGSFQYFAARYGLEIVAVIEPFPGSTPTGDYLQDVLKVVREKSVRALFSEPQLDPRPAQIIANEAKVPLGVLDPVGGGPDTDSYEKMLRFDTAALAKVLK